MALQPQSGLGSQEGLSLFHTKQCLFLLIELTTDTLAQHHYAPGGNRERSEPAFLWVSILPGLWPGLLQSWRVGAAHLAQGLWHLLPGGYGHEGSPAEFQWTSGVGGDFSGAPEEPGSLCPHGSRPRMDHTTRGTRNPEEPPAWTEGRGSHSEHFHPAWVCWGFVSFHYFESAWSAHVR